MGNERRITPPETPLPKAIAREVARQGVAHECLHPDAEILLEDVRQARRRRWWLATTMIGVVMASLFGLAAWIYSVGEAVGTTRSEMQYLQRAEEADRASVTRVDADIRRMELSGETRYSQIEQMLIRLDARLENIENSLSKRR